MRGSQAAPVDPGQAEFARSRLDMRRQDVVVTHGRASLDRLKDEIFRAIRLHHLVVPNGASSFDVNRDLLQAVDPLNHTWFNADRRVARLALRRVPVTTAAALINRQRVSAYVFPFEPDQFTDAESGPNGHKDHAGVRFGDQFHQVFELLWGDMWFGLSLSPSFRREANSVDWVLDQKAVLDG